MDNKKPSNPKSGAGADTPATSPKKPCPKCKITSETVATSPANRARTRIGVGEEVTLTVDPGPATWSIDSGGGTLSPSSGSHTKVTYTARDKAESVKITATGAGCSCTIAFSVVEPSAWTMKRKPSSDLKHTEGRPDCGWQGIMYVQPTDVNFYNVETREIDSKYVTTGSYKGFEGVYHGDYPEPERASAWFPLTRHSEADGSTDDVPDEIYSGDPGAAATGTKPPFKKGDGYFPITIQWKVGTGAPHDFPVVRQEHEIFEDGKCESRKGGHTEHTMYDDPTSTY